MDIKEKITTAVEKITKDPKMVERFKEEPVKVVEEVVGVDLPDDAIDKVIDAVKGKIKLDGVTGKLDSLKKLF